MSETTARPEAAPQSRWRLYAVLAVAALLALALAYWAGRMQVGADFSAYRDRQTETRAASVEANQQLQAENAALRGQVSLLEGRRQLNLALLALDARNFGQAKDHLTRAAAQLGEAADTVPAGSRNQLQALQRELQSAALVASEDFSRQRQQILAWTRQWDALISEEVAPTSPTDSASPATSGAP